MEMRIFNKDGVEKNVGVTVKTTHTSLNIIMYNGGEETTASFKRGTDFQTALKESKEVAKKHFFKD